MPSAANRTCARWAGSRRICRRPTGPTSIATLAIAGVPFTAGFFSKDSILWQAFSSPLGSTELWGIGWVTAGLTAFYMFRQLFMVFHGECRADEHVKAHIHESPAVMTLPLVVLAVGSIFAGWLGAPEYFWGSRWDHWLEPIFGGVHEVHHGSLTDRNQFDIAHACPWSRWVFLLAYFAYGRASKLPDRLASLAGGGSSTISLLHKYYVDELYDFLFVRPFTALFPLVGQVFDPWSHRWSGQWCCRNGARFQH